MPRANRCQEIHFAWQAQYLLKLECDFSWQAQYLLRFEVDFACSAHSK